MPTIKLEINRETFWLHCKIAPQYIDYLLVASNWEKNFRFPIVDVKNPVHTIASACSKRKVTVTKEVLGQEVVVGEYITGKKYLAKGLLAYVGGELKDKLFSLLDKSSLEYRVQAKIYQATGVLTANLCKRLYRFADGSPSYWAKDVLAGNWFAAQLPSAAERARFTESVMTTLYGGFEEKIKFVEFDWRHLEEFTTLPNGEYARVMGDVDPRRMAKIPYRTKIGPNVDGIKFKNSCASWMHAWGATHWHKIRTYKLQWILSHSVDAFKAMVRTIKPDADFRKRKSIEWVLGLIDDYDWSTDISSFHNLHQYAEAIAAYAYEGGDLISDYIVTDEMVSMPEFTFIDHKGGGYEREHMLMDHCIDTYYARASKKIYRAYHVVYNGEHATLGVVVTKGGVMHFDQVRGPRNRDNQATAWVKSLIDFKEKRR